MNRRHLIAATAAALVAGAMPAAAQTYPARPITMIIPFAAGGPTDVVARIVAEAMSKNLGQTIVIENVAGAGGTTGSTRLTQAAPDGYSIMIGHTGTHAASVALYPNLRYNPVSDFAPIGLVNTNAILITAKKALPANNLAEFVAWLKANERTANNAHAGIGSVSHTTCLLLHAILGVKPQSVPYRGTGPAMNDLVAGQVDYLCDQVVNVAPQVRAGTIKAFAVAQPQRNAALPDIPTTAEAGLPNYQVVVWNAMLAPKGTPEAIVTRLNQALVAALNDDGVKARLAELGADLPTGNLATPAGLRAFLEAEIAKWTPVIKEAGVTASN
ncbi:tripartite tricarboxylate transporter substrate-binding protein [Phreatobacter oligotrophus]|jgi:tripartite-type tricarboxylate transporter receptor subunit TctC|uniref:tripartite tricarboxylate transporter substrate-binding protein n=1 Tax=Phreatobacter oligotrophus TaxID=1122261 RepID=UPI002356CA2A|nr:tripartite tricarboxylate transporter substrate-binding protein [Phreatobacter oligotrophus]MBX9992785.1 tripartite tricarboxylate transporter substrate binding protein BugD [Phreatobacter oligotrophus]